jgi:(E)-4-hydroxy-3-methylbut-2-enyl-diphosphate synthase
MPICADIHFDYRLALRCLDFPIAKVRLNPGNIGGPKKTALVLKKAAAKGRPIRIGVNAGSLPLDLRSAVDRGGLARANALVQAALRELDFCRGEGFSQVVVSLKASSVRETIDANRLFALQSDVPLHIGVTEAGPLIAGVARNTAALWTLLGEGIGATIRVSLSSSMEDEVIAAREILNCVQGEDAPSRGIRVVSCPLCGRQAFDTHAFLSRHLNRLYTLDKNATVAVMGCAVNGPQEARNADLGITGAGDSILIFRQGQITRTVTAEEADSAFLEELEKL